MTRPVCACLILLSVAAAEEAPRRWALPEEVAFAEGRTPPFPTEVVVTESGRVGVFAFLKERGVLLRISKDGREPWTSIQLPLGIAGDARVEGERVEVVISDFMQKEASYFAFDLEKAEEVGRCRLPGGFPSMPMFTSLHAKGKDRFALVGCEQGHFVIFSSADEGKSWSDGVAAGRLGVRDDAVSPPLYVSEDGLHVVYVEKKGAIRHIVSADRGATWKDGAAIRLPEGAGVPLLAAGAQSGARCHAVFVTSTGAYVHAGSADGGATWGEGTKVGSIAKVDDMAYIFRVKAEGDRVAVGFSEPGPRINRFKKALLFVSPDAGKSWEESPLAEGVEGATGIGAIALGPEGAVWAAFGCSPEEGDEGTHYVLLRRQLATGAPREEWPAGREVPSWWKGAK